MKLINEFESEERRELATIAMKELIRQTVVFDDKMCKDLARRAYKIADAMLEEEGERV